MTKEEKDKLIKLSDLNREDNIKYISSEAQGIAITLDSDRFAPSMCKLERAYICGRRKSENRISELEEENAELKAENQKWKDEWQEQVQKATDEGYARTLQTIQLTKAKELLRDLIKFQPYIDKEAMFLSIGNEWKTVIYKAEQFLNSEVEK